MVKYDKGVISMGWITATAIMTALTLAGTVFGVSMSSVKEIAIDAQVKSNINSIAIASISTDLKWIKDALQTNGIVPIAKKEIIK